MLFCIIKRVFIIVATTSLLTMAGCGSRSGNLAKALPPYEGPGFNNPFPGQPTTPSPSPTPYLGRKPLDTPQLTSSIAAVAPLCGDVYGGTAQVAYQNGHSQSLPASVDFARPCDNAVIWTKSVKSSFDCGDSSGHNSTYCYNHPSNQTTIARSYPIERTRLGFDVFLSAKDFVYVGATNPSFFDIQWTAVCNPQAAPQCAVFVPPPHPYGDALLSFNGLARVDFPTGVRRSDKKAIALPYFCTNPTIVVQSYKDSIACANSSGGKLAAGQTCENSETYNSASQDVMSRWERTATGFNIYLESEFMRYVESDLDSKITIAYQLNCAL